MAHRTKRCEEGMRESEGRAVAEEELWSGWNQVENQVRKSTMRSGGSRSVESREKSGRSRCHAE